MQQTVSERVYLAHEHIPERGVRFRCRVKSIAIYNFKDQYDQYESVSHRKETITNERMT